MKLIGKKVKIVSDNENYDSFRNEVLTITHASNKGVGYDDSCYPEKLCDFKDSKGNRIPFALYEYEFQVL